MQEGDVVVVPNAGCLGFNLQEIARTWGRLTKEIGADVVVLDMPLMDTQRTDLGDMNMGDIALQVMESLAGVTLH